MDKTAQSRLNDMQGRFLTLDETAAAMYRDLKELVETYAQPKMYKVVKPGSGEVEEMEGVEYIEAIPLEALATYFQGDTSGEENRNTLQT